MKASNKNKNIYRDARRLDHSDFNTDIISHPVGYLDLEALSVDQIARTHENP